MAKHLIAFIFLLLSSPSQAQHYCNEPRRPHCLDGFDTFTNRFSFDSCASDMDRYRRDLIAFGQCLEDWVAETADEATEAQDKALREYNDAIDFWECKAADPRGFC